MASLKQNANEMLEEGSNAVINVVNLDSKYKLVRRGVAGDGSCFFHALFSDICGKTYFDLDSGDKKNAIERLRNNIVAKLDTVEKFKKLANGALVYVLSTQLINNLLLDFVNTNDKYKTKIDSLKTKILSCLSHIADATKYKELFDRNFTEDKTEIQDLITNLIQKAFGKYKSNLTNPSSHIGDEHISLIHTYLKVNILFITPKGRLYIRDKEVDCKANGLPFILMYYVNNNHYEPIFRKENNDTYNGFFNEKDEMIFQILKTC
jgi:hypothetical protein